MKLLERQNETIYKLAENIGLKNTRYFERYVYLERQIEKMSVGIVEKIADYYNEDLSVIYKELQMWRDENLILLESVRADG